jgi:hypothetical protein
MDAGIIPKPVSATKPRDPRQHLSLPEVAINAAVWRLSRRASLMLTFLLSLALWAAIWALASALLR